ncbi:MAG: hypothetical protein ISR65_19035 [Bacteriovoracaceae bacterium]|nr:hypothetical protein [Bacteriovoracaceae bacterium]
MLIKIVTPLFIVLSQLFFVVYVHADTSCSHDASEVVQAKHTSYAVKWTEITDQKSLIKAWERYHEIVKKRVCSFKDKKAQIIKRVNMWVKNQNRTNSYIVGNGLGAPGDQTYTAIDVKSFVKEFQSRLQEGKEGASLLANALGNVHNAHQMGRYFLQDLKRGNLDLDTGIEVFRELTLERVMESFLLLSIFRSYYDPRFVKICS